MTHQRETVMTDQKIIFCDGQSDDNNPGHPRVALNLGDDGKTTCPYCGRQFIKED